MIAFAVSARENEIRELNPAPHRRTRATFQKQTILAQIALVRVIARLNILNLFGRARKTANFFKEENCAREQSNKHSTIWPITFGDNVTYFLRRKRGLFKTRARTISYRNKSVTYLM